MCLSLINLTTAVDFMILSPLSPDILEDLKANIFDYSILVAVFTLASATSLLALLKYVQKVGRRKILLFAYFVFVLASISNALATSYVHLLVSRAITGASVGIVTSSIYTLLAQRVPPHMQGRASGVITAAIAVSTIACVPAGLHIASIYGWRASFLAISVLAASVFALAYCFIGADHTRGSRSATSMIASLLNTLRRKNLRSALVVTLFINISSYVSIPFLILFLCGTRGLSLQVLPTLYFVSGLATVITTPLIGKISDKVGAVHVLGYVTVGLVAAFVMILALPMNPPLWMVIFSVALLFVFNSGRMTSSLAITTAVSTLTSAPEFVTLNTLVTAGTIGLSTTAGGAIMTGRWGGDLSAYSVTTSVAIIAGISAYLTARTVNFRACR